MILVGALEKRFLAGAVWVLVTDDDVQYELRGAIPAELDGARVTVEGEPAEAAFSMHMVGEVIEVSAIRAARG